MEVEVVTPIVAEAEVQKYTLISDDIYVRRYTSTTVPDWYRNLIENLVAQDPTITDIQGAIDYLTSVDNGYAVQLVNLENQQSSTNALLTTLQSSNSNHTALIADLQVTKVDESSAQAIATNAVQSYINGGSANAWFTSQVSTYASEIEANASSISTLSASVDGLSVSIDDISYVSIDPITGYKLGASKLGTAPDGSITGWQFADGTGVQSTFKIMANNFQVSNGATGYTPFSISGSNVLFNGVVDFTNTNTYGTTTIDGGKITTGSITASQIQANSIGTNQLAVGAGIVNGYMQSSDFTSIGGAGFRLKSNAAGTSADPTIYGAYIKGGTIDGGVINVRNLQTVTDAGLYTKAIFSTTASSGSINIFAYNSTDGGTNRLSTKSNSLIVANGVRYGYLQSAGGFSADAVYVTMSGAGLCRYTTSSSNTATFNLYLGYTLLGSKTIGSGSSGVETIFYISGVGFSATYIAGYQSASEVRFSLLETSVPDLYGDGVLNFTVTGGGSIHYDYQPRITVVNL